MEPSQQYKFLRHALRDGRSFNSKSSFWDRVHLDPWLLLLLVLNALFGLIIVYSDTFSGNFYFFPSNICLTNKLDRLRKKNFFEEKLVI